MGDNKLLGLRSDLGYMLGYNAQSSLLKSGQ
jgi:hypothetical protein